MPRKSGQGLVLNRKSALSRKDGAEGNLSCVRKKGKVYLGYKSGNNWYYTQLSKKIDRERQIILANGLPRSNGELSIVGKKIVSKIAGANKEVLLNNTDTSIFAKKIILSDDVSFTDNDADNLATNATNTGPHGAAFRIGRQTLSKATNSEIDGYKVIDKYTETGGTIDSVYLGYFDRWELESDSANVTATDVATLFLGVPSGGENVTLTNKYALHLEGNIKSHHLNIIDSGNITLDVGGQVLIQDDSANKPELMLKSTYDGVQGPKMKFLVDRDGAGTDLDYLGTIEWHGYNNAGTPEDITTASITSQILSRIDSNEKGSLTLNVLAITSGASVMKPGIFIAGTATNNEVDVNIGSGADSLTTIAGNVDIDGDTITSAGSLVIDSSNNLSFDANSGIFNFQAAGDADDAFKITVAGGTGATTLETLSDGADGHLRLVSDGYTKIDSASNITLDAVDGEILLEDGGTKFGEFTTGGTISGLLLYENGGVSTDDYLSIVVGNQGATIISTVDANATAADLALTIDGGFDVDAAGDITLDSDTGVFEMRSAGTIRKFADMYAGMILGYTTVGIDATTDSYTITTSMVVPDAALKVTFVIPPSGTVEIFASIFADHAGTRGLLFGLSTSSSYVSLDVTHEHEVLTSDETDEQQVNHRWVITGLTPGEAETYWLGAQGQQAGSVVLRWGGDVTAEYGPFIMKATALPAAVTDYAVYG